MALTATVRRFELELADSDRGVYASLDWRVAQHPSEHARYLVARLVARALEHADGVEFTRGLAADDEPAVWQRDLRGDLVAWIEVGAPSPERLHRAGKTGARVVVYAWRAPEDQARAIALAGVHRAGELVLRALDPAFLDAVAATLDRTNRWELAVSGGTVYLSAGGKSFETPIREVPIAT